jgi:hypothetical protein
MPDNFNDDIIDREARCVTQMMKDGDHLSAASKLQEDARAYRPGEFTELVGQVRALSKSQDTLTHLEIDPLPTPDGDPRGKLNVSMVTPAIDGQGRQYVDQNGRPMVVVEPVAQIDNHERVQVVNVCPRVEIPPPPIYVERPWLRLDEHRERVRFDVRLPGIGIDVNIGGGRDWERRPDFDRGRWGSGHYESGRWESGRWDGGSRESTHGNNNNNNSNNRETTINNTTIINKTEVKNTTVNKNETINRNETVNNNNNSRHETVVTRPPQHAEQQHAPARRDDHDDKHDKKKK